MTHDAAVRDADIRTFYGLMLTGAVLFLTSLGLAIAAIWTSGDIVHRLGWTAGICFGLGLICAGAADRILRL